MVICGLSWTDHPGVLTAVAARGPTKQIAPEGGIDKLQILVTCK